jgi:hypothetical protein
MGIDPVSSNGSAYDRAAASGLMGLCFSGGGIRSATFNLGILQGLAELKLLRSFDYLSTVSGGGYVHQWFAAWISRRSFKEVEERLVPLPETGIGCKAVQDCSWNFSLPRSRLRGHDAPSWIGCDKGRCHSRNWRRCGRLLENAAPSYADETSGRVAPDGPPPAVPARSFCSVLVLVRPATSANF